VFTLLEIKKNDVEKKPIDEVNYNLKDMVIVQKEEQNNLSPLCKF